MSKSSVFCRTNILLSIVRNVENTAGLLQKCRPNRTAFYSRSLSFVVEKKFCYPIRSLKTITKVNASIRLINPPAVKSVDLFRILQSNMSSEVVGDKNISYDQLVKHIETRDSIIIDVREKEELKETGEIPGSHNIPVGEVPTALNQMNEVDFKSKYGFCKPTYEDTLIFSCRSGKRSLTALDAAMKAGYCNSLNFAGGWLDWEKHTKN